MKKRFKGFPFELSTFEAKEELFRVLKYITDVE